MRKLAKVLMLLGLAAIVMFGYAAQTQAQPNLVGGGACKVKIPPPANTSPSPRANVLTVSPNGNTIHVFAYAPGKSAPATINQRVSSVTLNSFGRFAISSDGRLGAWFATSTPTTPTTLDYEAIGEGKCASVTIPQGFSTFDVKFLDDQAGLPHYMTYVLENGEKQTWILGFIDVYAGTYVEFLGNYQAAAGKTPPIGFVGVADVLGWNPQTGTLILSSYTPFADGQAQRGIYALTVSDLRLDSKRVPFPTARVVLPRETGLGVALSLDGSKLAYLLADPNAQPTGYKPFDGPGGGGPAATGLTVIDITSGKQIAGYKATQAQGFGTYTWTLDSKQILFTTGSYLGSYSLLSPAINTLDLATGAVTVGSLLVADRQTGIVELHACADSLFFTTYQPNGANGQSALFSASLSNLAIHSSVLASADFINMVNCISG